MAVTQWVIISPGLTAGRPHAMPGIVVNGGAGQGDPDPIPEYGRERPPATRP